MTVPFAILSDLPAMMLVAPGPQVERRTARHGRGVQRVDAAIAVRKRRAGRIAANRRIFVREDIEIVGREAVAIGREVQRLDRADIAAVARRVMVTVQVPALVSPQKALLPKRKSRLSPVSVPLSGRSSKMLVVPSGDVRVIRRSPRFG